MLMNNYNHKDLLGMETFYKKIYKFKIINKIKIYKLKVNLVQLFLNAKKIYHKNNKPQHSNH
jgi:hypothetical protein